MKIKIVQLHSREITDVKQTVRYRCIPNSMLLTVGLSLAIICPPLRAEQMDTQTPEEFLQVVKSIAESDDLSDYQAVALKLKMNVTASPETIVRSDSDQRILGEKISLQFNPIKTKNSIFQMRVSMGSIFFPDRKKFKRISFGFRIDTAEICVKKDLFYRVFNDRIEKSFPTDSFAATDISHFYRVNKRNFLSVNADFNAADCMAGIGFLQNIERDED